MSLEAAIKEIILERLLLSDEEAAKLKDDTGLFGAGDARLDLDSLAGLDILAGLSDRFGQEFDSISARDFESVSTLAAYLRGCGVKD